LKLCTACQETLPLEAFSKKATTSDGLQYKCKPCDKVYKKAYYMANADSIKAKVIARRRATKLRVDAYKANAGCADCGFSDHRALDFDHLGDKSFGISEMVKDGMSWSSIMAEARKCEVVCANCHRIRTHERLTD
jgi:hypothetical protein